MKNTKILVVLLVLVLLTALVISGCASKAEPQENNNDNGSTDNNNEPPEEDPQQPESEPEGEIEWLTFTSEEHGFTIEYPSSWIIVDTSTYAVVFRPYEGTQTTFYVEIHTSIFDDYTYDDYVTEMIEEIKRIYPEYEYTDTANIDINEYPFVSLGYTAETSEGVTYYYQCYYTAFDYGYRVYYVIPENEYEQIQPIAEQMAHSFKFTK